MSPTMPSYVKDLLHSGLGFAALQMGELADARFHEGRLGSPPSSWYFDPTTLLAFRSRLLARRGEPESALQLLSEASTDLRGRLVLAWLKVQILRIGLARRMDGVCAAALAEEGWDVARELALQHRLLEFEQLLGATA